MNKSSEATMYFEDLLGSPKGISDTFGLGYISTYEKGKSSSNGEKKINKGKPTCHHCGKMGHIDNICRSKNESQCPKKNTKGKC